MAALKRNEDRNPWFYLSVLLSFLLLLSGVSGIVDGLVEWKDRFKPLVGLYVYLRAWLIGLLPFRLPVWIADYLVIGSGVLVAARMAVKPLDFLIATTWFRSFPAVERATLFTGKYLRMPSLPAASLILLFWPIVLWRAARQFRRMYASARDYLLPQAEAGGNAEFVRDIKHGLEQARAATDTFLKTVAVIFFAVTVVLFVVVDYRATHGQGEQGAPDANNRPPPASGLRE